MRQFSGFEPKNFLFSFLCSFLLRLFRRECNINFEYKFWMSVRAIRWHESYQQSHQLGIEISAISEMPSRTVALEEVGAGRLYRREVFELFWVCKGVDCLMKTQKILSSHIPVSVDFAFRYCKFFSERLWFRISFFYNLCQV